MRDMPSGSSAGVEGFSESDIDEVAGLYSGRSVMVAGGTGMIGRELVGLLDAAGASVSVSGLDDPRVAEQILPQAVEYCQFDWSAGRATELLRDREVVFNLLGRKGSVGIGESKVASYLLPMLRFQANLVESAHDAGVQEFLFVSSLNVYPQSARHFEDNAWNGMPLQNDRIPGIGKRVGEILGLAFELEFGWDAVRIVRPANVYGPNDVLDPIGSHVIPSLIRKLILDTSGTVEVWGDGSAIRDFIYSKDCAFWIAKAATNLPANTPTNLGSGDGVSIRDLALLIRRLVGYHGELRFAPDMPTGDPVRVLDMGRAKDLLGWMPKTSLEAGLTATIQWANEALSERNKT